MILIALPFPVPTVPAPVSQSNGGSGAPVGTAPEAPDEESADGTSPEQTDFAAMLAALVAPTATPQVVAAQPTVPGVEVADVVASAPAVAVPTLPVVPVAVEAAAIATTPAPVAVTTVAVAPEAPLPEVEVETPLVDVATTPDAAPAPILAEVAAPEVDPIDEPAPVEVDLAPVTEEAPAPQPRVQDHDAPKAEPLVATAPVAEVVDTPAAPVGEQAGDAAPVVSEAEAAPSPAPAPAPVQPRRPDAVVPQAAETARPEPMQPHTPVVTAIAPLIQRGDGSYHLSVRLHPVELGEVDVDVELRSGEINLRITPLTDSGREAIRASLPALRAELEAAGVRAGMFDLGDRQSGQTPDGRRQPSSPAFVPTAPTADPTTDDRPEAVADGAVDVRL